MKINLLLQNNRRIDDETQQSALLTGCHGGTDTIRSAALSRQGTDDNGRRLITILDSWLLDDEQKAVLASNPLNSFYLRAAADLKHEKNIIKNRKALGIAELFHAQVISGIVDISNQTIDQWLDAKAIENFGSGTTLPLNWLAAALALAERLDLRQPVTLQSIRRHMAESAQPVSKNWARGFHVQSSGPDPNKPGSILICIHCRDAELHRALKHYETEVHHFLCELNKRIRPRFLFGKVRFQIWPDGYVAMDYRFVVDSSAALKLFTGNTLYDDKRVFLRELLQNAVDACHMRSLYEHDYTPSICVHLNAAEDIITVRDNGIGMDRKWLEKYFLNVGISFYRSDELGDLSPESGLNVHFISNFGIGFLSTFQVARRVMVRTRKAGAQGLIITIYSIDEYFDVRRAEEHLPIGTEVILELKPSRVKAWRAMEFCGYLKSMARFVSIPIKFTDAQGNITVIGCEPMNSFGSTGSAGQNFTAALAISPSRGYLLIRTRGSDDRIFGLDSASGGISIFQNGIFITQTDVLLPARARGYVVGRLDLMGNHICELSMDRSRLFWPQQLLRFLRHAVLKGIADATAKMMKTIDCHHISPLVRHKMEMTVADFFEPTDVDDTLFEALDPGIQNTLRQHFRSFLRTSISKADMPDQDLSAIAAAHGYQSQWQKSVIAAMVRQ